MSQPAEQLQFHFPAQIIPRSDGSYLIRPGKPVPIDADCSPKEAAKIIGCSRNTIYLYIADGSLTARQTKQRAKIRLSRREVLALANRQLTL